MTENEKWEAFYEKVGGKYICAECGNILTWFQKNNAGRVKTLEIVLAFVIAVPISFIITPAGGGLLVYIYLHNFAKRVGCPICHAKQERIIRLNSSEGMAIFKVKHADHTHLLKDLSAQE